MTVETKKSIELSFFFSDEELKTIEKTAMIFETIYDSLTDEKIDSEMISSGYNALAEFIDEFNGMNYITIEG